MKCLPFSGRNTVVVDAEKYRKWIEEYSSSNAGKIRGLCFSASQKMVQEFPELKQERGYAIVPNVVCGDWSEPHWWCVAPDGQIYDPTASQFVDIIRYEPYSEEVHGPLPTGKCYDCGTLLYDSKNFCDERCEASTRAYLGF